MGEFSNDFERAHKFKRYFPDDNFDCVATRYEKNRKTIFVVQKFRSGYIKPNSNITSELVLAEDHQEKFKSMGLYTFYPEMIRNRLLKSLTKRHRSSKQKKISLKSEKCESITTKQKSVFFKRQEFKNKQTFSGFVDSVMAMAKSKEKKPKSGKT